MCQQGVTVFFCSYLADIDASVLIIVGPVAQCQAKLLLAVLPTQFHLLLHKQTSNVYNVMPDMSLHFFPVDWMDSKIISSEAWDTFLYCRWIDITLGRSNLIFMVFITILVTLGMFCYPTLISEWNWFRQRGSMFFFCWCTISLMLSFLHIYTH